MALIDISRSVSPTTAVWPGDQEIEWAWSARLNDEDSSVNLGAIRLSTHAGTHVDAPFHISNEGETTSEFSLPTFVGPADVVEVQDDVIRPEHVEDVTSDRVLFKTPASALSDEEWPDSITPFAVETIDALSARGAILVGTDAPSVDPLDSTDLSAHHALISHGIVNLEGLRLNQVFPGRYYLMAFPLKISGADAAPVRAVLSDTAPW